MSRKREPDTPIPTHASEVCLTYDRTLMSRTTSFVEESVGPVVLSLVRATTRKTALAKGDETVNTAQFLVHMYYAFKDEGTFFAITLLRIVTHILAVAGIITS